MVQKINDIVDDVKSYIEQGIFPGATFAVLDGTNDVQKFVMGEAQSLPEPEKLRPGMLWDLASVSKVVGVGTVIIDRVLSGELELDRPFQDYYRVWHERTVTLRQLLTHTSGIDPFIEHREKLNCTELIVAMNQLTVNTSTEKQLSGFTGKQDASLQGKIFHYTDVNFILLGLMLEKLDNKPLDKILKSEVFDHWGLTQTGFGPVNPKMAVPTALGIPRGVVHDPKARVLGIHCGSAGLFSNLSDLTAFVKGYFSDTKYLQLLKSYSCLSKPLRSLAWDLLSDEWLLHTGYTGTFVLMNLRDKQAVMFLSNRVHLQDEQLQWKIARNKLIKLFIKRLST